MNRLADEAAYFGAVADGVESCKEEIESLRQQLAERDEQISDLTISSDTYFAERNSARDVWRRASKDRDELRQQLAEAQADAIEQARIVGMGGEREIDLRQKLEIVSALLRETAGRMSYGHWSSEFRARVEAALKSKKLK